MNSSDCKTYIYKHYFLSSILRRNPISGIAVKVCLYDESDHMTVQYEDKIFYTEDDFRDFLSRRGWTSLRELNVAYRNIENLDDLRPGAIYRGGS